MKNKTIQQLIDEGFVFSEEKIKTTINLKKTKENCKPAIEELKQMKEKNLSSKEIDDFIKNFCKKYDIFFLYKEIIKDILTKGKITKKLLDRSFYGLGEGCIFSNSSLVIYDTIHLIQLKKYEK